MKNNTKANNIFAKIILEQAHLDFINDNIAELKFENDNLIPDDDKIATFNFLSGERTKTEDRIRELKKDYIDAMNTNTVTGKIEINYENIPDDVRWELYHFLNRLALDVPGFGYRTIENEIKYAKDYNND